MKLFILLVMFYPGRLMAQSSVYNLSIQGLDGKTIKLSDYKGKKILIASASPDALKNDGLRFFDSLQSAYPQIVVIAIPANDFGGTKNTEIIDEIKSDVSKHIIIASPADVKKNKGRDQNSILKWLTSISDNTHFDDDVQTDIQSYVISESGILYAVLLKTADPAAFKNILTQEDMKQ